MPIAKPIARALFATGRPRYEIRADGDGWFVHERIADLAERKQVYFASINTSSVPAEIAAQIRLEHGTHAYVPRFRVLERKDIHGAILTPFIASIDEDTARACFDFETHYRNPATGAWVQIERILATHDLVYGDPDDSDMWEWADSEDGLFLECTQKHDEWQPDPNVATTYPIKSRVWWSEEDGLCPNLFFAAGIRRQSLTADMVAEIEDAEEGEDIPQNLLWTNIYFGGPPGEWGWCLHIPQIGKPVLMEATPPDDDGDQMWVRREWTDGELSKIDPYEISSSGKTYRFGVIGDCICISESNFEDGFAYYRVRDRGQPIVPHGDLMVENYPGACTVWLAPMRFSDWTSYDPWMSRACVQLFGPYIPERTNDPVTDKPNLAVYGYTLKGWGLESTEYVWPSSQPDWWPLSSVPPWWGADDPAYFRDKYPSWPPYGPPGKWPPYPPYLWPPDTQWPPVDESGELRECPDPVLASVPSITGGGVSLQHWGVGSDDPQRMLSWMLSVEPVGWTAGTIPTWSTPLVESIAIWQTSEITDNGEPTFGAVTEAHEVTVAAGLENGEASMVTMTCDNFPGNWGYVPAKLLRKGAMVSIETGVRYTDGTAEYWPWGKHIILEVCPSVSDFTVTTTDPLGWLFMCEWDLGKLYLKGWNSAAAIAYLCSLYGFGPAMLDLEDIGALLEGDSWEYEIGTSVGEIITDIASRGQRKAALWYDPVNNKIATGCPYCRTKRTESTWDDHSDNGWASSGCLAADLARNPTTDGIDLNLVAAWNEGPSALAVVDDLRASDGAIRRGEYANRITVVGRTMDGGEIWWRWHNQDATGPDADPGDDYVGFVVSYVDRDDNLETWGPLRERLTQLREQMQAKHMTIDDVKLLIHPGLRPGHRVKVLGADAAGVDGKQFRVTQVQHDPRSCRTTVSGREMPVVT